MPKNNPWHIIGKRALGLCAPDFLGEAPSCSPPHATGRKRATSPRASRGESLRAFRVMKAFASFFKSKEDALLDRIFELKFTAKQLSRTAAKCEKEERQLKAKVKVAIEKGNLDGAKIHATDAIRKKNEQLNMLKLSSRLDGVVSRLEAQAKMNMVNKNMAGIVKSLDQSLKDMNLEAVSNNMDQFERQFENLDVQTEFVEQAMSSTTAATTPADEVTNRCRRSRTSTAWRSRPAPRGEQRRAAEAASEQGGRPPTGSPRSRAADETERDVRLY